MQRAVHFRNRENQVVQCLLCPHHCNLKPGEYGKCHTRMNQDGQLVLLNYGVISSYSTDPIEKKPLYHFYPGHSILSIGSFGCNLTCDFCQNCEISQVDHTVFSRHPSRTPEDIVHRAVTHRSNIGLAYTYNEPTVYYEYMLACAALIKEKERCNVMVTNGYINREPLQELLPYMDAFNVDLKSFTNKFYKLLTGATLAPVLRTIQQIAKSDKHLELTFLIIPGYNDKRREWQEMIQWIVDHCGNDTILHVSRYYPHYKFNIPMTPLSTIREFLDLARKSIHYVYPGNTPQLENHTYCPSCGALLIHRFLYTTSVQQLGSDGRCKQCNYSITGNFNTMKA